MDETTDLVNRVKQGDQQAFGKLYDNYSGAIFGVISRIIPDKQIAEDVLQETFVRAWNKIHLYDSSKGRFYTWIYRLARNASINNLRKKRLENHSVDDGVYIEKGGVTGLNSDTIGLSELVMKLDKKYRDIFELIYFKGYTQQEVHEELDIPLGTVKTRLRRALLTLREQFDVIAFLLILNEIIF